MPNPFVTSDQERRLLEACLAECKRRLNHFREIGNEIQVALTEADLDRILEELQRTYKRRVK